MKRRKRSKEGFLLPFQTLANAMILGPAWLAWGACLGMPLFQATYIDQRAEGDPFTPIALVTWATIVVVGFLVVLTVTFYAYTRPERYADFDPYCTECGLNLLGTWPVSLRCPECSAGNDFPESGHCSGYSFFTMFKVTLINLVGLGVCIWLLRIVLRVFV